MRNIICILGLFATFSVGSCYKDKDENNNNTKSQNDSISNNKDSVSIDSVDAITPNWHDWYQPTQNGKMP